MGGYEGQPMMGGYDPQQQWTPQEQAEWDLADLEEKKRLRDEKDKKREVEQLSKMIRTQGRDSADSKTCANILCMWGILNGLLWTVPLLGDQWWNKIWHGLSIDKLTITLGLFNMHVAVDCKDTFSGDLRLCKSMQQWADHEDGNWAMAELAEKMCKMDKGSCDIIDKMALSGWIPLCGLPMAAAFEVLAVLLLFFYWSGKPTGLVRKLANQCGVMAPVIGNLSFMGWMIVCPYLTEVPRRWAAIGGDGQFANSSLFGLKETSTLPTGWCSMVLIFVAVSSMIRFFIQFTLPASPSEPDGYDVDESSRLVSEAEAMYNGKA